MAQARVTRAKLNRRALITGRVLGADRIVAPPGAEIASIIVQARPEKLAEVEAEITAMPGCEIHARDVRGKLIVVTEAPDAGSLGTMLNTIQSLRYVYSAALVFHAIETA
ncbi:nitrate reductase NapD [Bradyrhizobium huanghuaihaiense]|uniref:Chaperone NapD n=1 Tax=Bradyrhizobium huanghuaihaiense TaxID=990078 RepID=A0A562RUN8_9BRAD|nr:chaperone NapD [Bradyrhizobium huanghuaihaiense]TWI72797.1 periplasmic nitrate reductase chaperone NapD [Bradyrhizobium huanghuaihaiense]